jgi:hypothetical protein
MSPGDKRRDERVAMLGTLHGEIMVFQSITVREISPHGVSIETAYALQIDSLHDVRLSLGERSVVVKCRVVHSHLSDVEQDTVHYRSGLEFVEPTMKTVAAIEYFLETVKENRRGS